MKIKTGDVVKLRSGGPEMTVEAVEQGEGEVRCVFFNATGSWDTNEEDTFVSYALNRLTVRSETLRVVMSLDDEDSE